jgi:hypothetical protein
MDAAIGFLLPVAIIISAVKNESRVDYSTTGISLTGSNRIPIGLPVGPLLSVE